MQQNASIGQWFDRVRAVYDVKVGAADLIPRLQRGYPRWLDRKNDLFIWFPSRDSFDKRQTVLKGSRAHAAHAILRKRSRQRTWHANRVQKVKGLLIRPDR